MTNEEYRKFLKDLEHDIFNSYPVIGLTNAKSIVSKADMKSIAIVSTKLNNMLMSLQTLLKAALKNMQKTALENVWH